MNPVYRSKSFWLCVFFLVVALVSRCVFDTSGIAYGPRITSGPPSDGCRNGSYSFTFTGQGGTTPYAWNLSGSVPPGLKLDSATGILAGAPTQNGSYKFTLEFEDKAGATLAEDYVVTIKDFNITDAYDFKEQEKPVTRLIYCPGSSFDHAIQTCGGKSPLTWSLVAGTLPSGIQLLNGHISGTTSLTGKHAVTVRVTDSAGQTAEHDYSLEAASSVTIITSGHLPQGQTSKPYTNTQLEACGGTTPYTWDDPKAGLPAGLTLSSSGLISGTPKSAGTTTVEIRVTDSKSASASRSFTLTVIPGPLSVVTTSPLTDGKECTYQSWTMKATGGSGSYSWKLASGSQAPNGLTLNAAGVLSGTPTTPGSYSFTLQVNDGTSTVSGTFALKIDPSPASTTALVFPEVRQGTLAVNTVDLAATPKVQADFRFTTFAFPANFLATAELSVVGLCLTSISAVSFSLPQDLNADGLKEVAARFDVPDVKTLLTAAGLATTGAKPTLRLKVTVTETGAVYYQTIVVTIL